jgi:tRNA threonylcarbamoyladenosine biosynthesis protein TsaE
MNRCVFVANSLADTDRLGAVLANALPDGTTIALCGTLGAGKTRLVQAIAAAHGVPRESVVSPTFVLCQEYSGTRTIYHLDAYRLQDADEFLKLGPEEYFQSPGLTFVEWGDRVSEGLPVERIEIHIEVQEGDCRQFEILGFGQPMEAVVSAIEERLSNQPI